MGLHGASEHGDTDRVRSLLLHGADVLSRDRYSDTPLHKATVHGHSETAKLLLVSGADASAVNAYGWTPLHYAAAAGAVDAARLLLVWGAAVCAADGQGDSPLHLAAYYGHSATVTLLLAWGADVDAVREGGITPLHWAASQGHAEVSSQLLERGSNPRRADAAGDCPLHVAARAGHAQVVAALLAGGAPSGATGANGDTALHCAAEAGSVAAVQALLGAGLSTSAHNHSGAHPLHAAAGATAVGVTAALLAAGADPRAVDAAGFTALHHCVSVADAQQGSGVVEVAEALLQAGCPCDCPCSAGWTPLHMAAATGATAVVDLLLRYGATGGAGAPCSPCDVASDMGHTHLVQLLSHLGRADTQGGGEYAAQLAAPGHEAGLTLNDIMVGRPARSTRHAGLLPPTTQHPPHVPVPSAAALAGMVGDDAEAQDVAPAPPLALPSPALGGASPVFTPGGAIDAAAAVAAAVRIARSPGDVAQQLAAHQAARTAAAAPTIEDAAPPVAAPPPPPLQMESRLAVATVAPATSVAVSVSAPPSDARQVAFEALALRLAGRVFAAMGSGHSRDAYAAAFLVELRHAEVPHSSPFVAPVVYRHAVVATHTADVWLHPTVAAAARGGEAAHTGTAGGVLALTAVGTSTQGVPADALKALEACLAAAPGVPSGGVLNFNPSGRLDARFLHRT